MRLRLRLNDPGSSTGTGREVLLECDEGTTFGDVRAQLERLTVDPGNGFEVDGLPLGDHVAIGQPPLLQGVTLTARSSTSAQPPSSARQVGLLELHVVGGAGAGRRFPLARGEHLIGRGPQCTIRLDDAGVSRLHARITVDDDGVHFRDVEPTNASFVDGDLTAPSGVRLEAGARVRLASTTLVLRSPVTTPAPAVLEHGILRLHRRPRFVTAAFSATVDFPKEPERREGARLPLLASLAPLVLSGALALALRSPVMLLFALMSPVMLLGQWWSDRRNGRKSFRRQLTQYTVATTEAEEQLIQTVLHEEAGRRDEHPDLAALTLVAQLRDSRLWQRGHGDPDDLVVRLGTAQLPARTTVTGSPGRVVPPCRDVPLTCDLAEAGVLGLAGPRERVLALAGSVLAQLSVWHSPQRLELVLLTTAPQPERDWEWIGPLPHLGGRHRALVSLGILGSGNSLATRIGELSEGLAERVATRAVHDEGALASLPSIVVVLDGAADLRAVAGLAELLRQGPAHGIRFVCLDQSTERLPAETGNQVQLHWSAAPRMTVTTRAGVVGSPGTAVPDLPTQSWLKRLGRALAPLQDATPQHGEAALPDRLGFCELAATQGIEPASAASLAQAWAGSGPPRALIGVTREGAYWLDLADQGPHMLVGGTTGSGKSEMLQTLVAGLAVSSRPDDLGFVLIDYKGGSAFKECARLPHVLGMVTDLDESLTTRALVSLGAELKRRERVLAASGSKDLDDHRRRRVTDSSLPRLGRLVIVVDEFKMLADELPDFVAGLVQLAAIGRSLGVHLVLATQRPGGIVSADMRANVSLRVALRVRDRSDSDDVIEDPRAVGISDRMPGRAFVRTADQRLIEVQFAHVGAPLATEQQAGIETQVWPLTWSELAEPAPRSISRRGGERSELSAVVEATRRAAEELSAEASPAPWLDPLPDLLPVAELSRTGGGAPFGLCDLPEEQRQTVLTWQPAHDGHLGLADGSRTGRSTALRTLVVGLAERHSTDELHVHVIEGRRDSLTDLAALPHVGSVTAADNPTLARRVISRIVAAARTDDPREARAAHTVLVIDGWEAFDESLAAVEHGAPVDEVLRLARDGRAAGVHLLVTGGRAVSTGRLAGLLQRRIVLSMPDPLDLTLAGVDARGASVPLPPGRGFELPSGHLVQLAYAGATVSDVGQHAAVATAADLALLRSRDVPAGLLPFVVRPLPVAVSPADLVPTCGRIALGLGGDAAGTVELDPAASGRRMLVAGPARSGRSTTLALITRQLVAAGRPVALVTGRRSRLAELRGLPGVLLLAPGEPDEFIELRRAHPELGIIVDDAENLAGTPMEAALLEATALVDIAEGMVAVAVETQRALGLFRGLVPEVARDGCGILLSPASATDGDLLRVRVDVTGRRPGLGLFVNAGSVTPLQVADAFADGAWPSERVVTTSERA